jgi:hypothetical protein
MFRKLSLVAVTVASPGAAALALAPTSASASGWNGGWHHGFGPAGRCRRPRSCGYASPSMAAVTCSGWSPPPGAGAGSWSTAAKA